MESFKSCPRVGGITIYHTTSTSGDCFKSCPRVGGINTVLPSFTAVRVSSRAPVWGASNCKGLIFEWRLVSSRAPVWGASSGKSTLMVRLAVSSRAPVWGASGKHRQHQRQGRVSSRAPVWGASPRATVINVETQFQVVPPCGGHLSNIFTTAGARGFKSCPRVGGIFFVLCITLLLAKFQVVPPCGGHPCQGGPSRISNPVSSRAPVWGASQVLQFVVDHATRFKSCPRVGGIL